MLISGLTKRLKSKIYLLEEQVSMLVVSKRILSARL